MTPLMGLLISWAMPAASLPIEARCASRTGLITQALHLRYIAVAAPHAEKPAVVGKNLLAHMGNPPLLPVAGTYAKIDGRFMRMLVCFHMGDNEGPVVGMNNIFKKFEIIIAATVPDSRSCFQRKAKHTGIFSRGSPRIPSRR